MTIVLWSFSNVKGSFNPFFDILFLIRRLGKIYHFHAKFILDLTSMMPSLRSFVAKSIRLHEVLSVWISKYIYSPGINFFFVGNRWITSILCYLHNFKYLKLIDFVLIPRSARVHCFSLRMQAVQTHLGARHAIPNVFIMFLIFEEYAYLLFPNSKCSCLAWTLL